MNEKNYRKPCDRCGVVRVVKVAGRTGLCRDCLSVMTTDELRGWVRGKGSAVS